MLIYSVAINTPCSQRVTHKTVA